MIYREGTLEDFQQIESIVSGSGYYPPISAHELGGAWIIAEQEGNVVGCVWCFFSGPQAFVDYLCVAPHEGISKVAGQMLVVLERKLIASGVKYVRAVVKDGNSPAYRLTTRGMGAGVDPYYTYVFKEL
jgi:hypothetical protein